MFYDSMYVKNDGQLKSFKRIELTSDSGIILVYTETGAGIIELYMFSSDSPNHYTLRSLLSTIFSILSVNLRGNNDIVI